MSAAAAWVLRDWCMNLLGERSEHLKALLRRKNLKLEVGDILIVDGKVKGNITEITDYFVRCLLDVESEVFEGQNVYFLSTVPISLINERGYVVPKALAGDHINKEIDEKFLKKERILQ